MSQSTHTVKEFQITCSAGYNEFDFFFKIKNTDPLMGANLNLRHIYLISFFIFGAVFARLASKFEKCTL
jgi:hypothetical protein